MSALLDHARSLGPYVGGGALPTVLGAPLWVVALVATILYCGPVGLARWRLACSPRYATLLQLPGAEPDSEPDNDRLAA